MSWGHKEETCPELRELVGDLRRQVGRLEDERDRLLNEVAHLRAEKGRRWGRRKRKGHT